MRTQIGKQFTYSSLTFALNGLVTSAFDRHTFDERVFGNDLRFLVFQPFLQPGLGVLNAVLLSVSASRGERQFPAKIEDMRLILRRVRELDRVDELFYLLGDVFLKDSAKLQSWTQSLWFSDGCLISRSMRLITNATRCIRLARIWPTCKVS